MAIGKRLITLVAILGINLSLVELPAHAESPPTVTITSPSSGTTQKGKVVITGLATPDSSGSARIIEIGIKVTGKSTSSGFDKREIVYVETGQTSNQTSWSFGTAGTADGVWTPEARDAGKFSLSFDTTSWPNQTYEITLFAKDSNQRSSASKSIEFTTLALAPTVTITSPSSGTTQKGKVVITGLATPDSSGSARIIEIGIKVTGKSTSSGFDKREIVYVETGQTSNQTSWSFGTAGTADGVWTPEARDAGKFSLSFDTTSWPNQTYEITLFAKDSNQRSSASKSIEFTTLALAPTVTITSPSSGTTQKGKVVITGLATPDSSGSARIIEIGIKVTGKSTSSGFDKREIVYVETGQTSNQTSWSFGTAGTADGVWTPEARDAGKFSLSFDTTSWPNQTYEITLFAKDSNQRSSASKSIEFTKPRGPILTIENEMSCELENKSYVGYTTTILCKSRKEIPEVPVVLEYLKGNTWTTFSKDKLFEGSSGYFDILFNRAGTTKVRLKSPGFMKQISPYYENVQVKPFISNELTVKTVAAQKSNPNTGSSSSGQGTYSVPKGKVDKKSNAYKFMFTAGKNFAKVSLATDTARSQCLSALNTGLIKVRGIPQYLGAQASQIRSYLKTPSGFQGCLDGFGK